MKAFDADEVSAGSADGRGRPVRCETDIASRWLILSQKWGNDMMTRFMHRSLSIAASVGLGLVLANPASAAVRYTFTAYSGPEINGEQINGGGFSIVVPNYIASDQSFTSGSLINCSVSTTVQPVGGSCGDQDFYLSTAFNYIGFETTTALNPATYAYYYFIAGAFSAPGTYTSLSPLEEKTGQLLVENLADIDTPAVPEPASWALMMLGFGAAGFALRRRPVHDRILACMPA